MSDVIVPRTEFALGGEIDPRPAWFVDAHGSPFLRCKCGELFTLRPPMFHVEPFTGKVTPTVMHDEAHCMFSASIRLDQFNVDVSV